MKSMNAILNTSVQCAHCRRLCPVRVKHPGLRHATGLGDAMELAEQYLSGAGWEFLTGEVERADGDLEFLVGLWCPTCASRFRAYQDGRGAQC